MIMLNADFQDDRDLLNNINGERAASLFKEQSIVCIDEAQRLTNAGLTLKIIHDNCNNIQLIATGSSAFEISDIIKEAMTGRKRTIRLFPFSFNELAENSSIISELRSLDQRLIYGSYPDVINNPGDEKEILYELISDYLYKDLLSLQGIRKPEIIDKIIKALAYQVGSQVSFREISQLVQADKETVEKYIRLLEEAQIIYQLGSFSRNLRNELKFSRKYYFFDNGIRNAVIGNFQSVQLRSDVGALWENYLISERQKCNEYNGNYANSYFWRTVRQHEIDYIEEKDGILNAFEFKYAVTKGDSKAPLQFSQSYPQSTFKVITPENYMEFLV